MMRRKLHLRRDRDRSIANRHPWIFSGAIAREEGPEDAAVGELVSSDGRVVAVGFHSRHSQIRLRVFSYDELDLDEAALSRRIEEAVTRRSALLDPGTDCVRLVNSEGDGLSGLVVDWYAGVAVVEITSAGVEQFRETIVETLQRRLAPQGIAFSNRSGARKLERLSAEDHSRGDVPGSLIVREHGVTFRVQPGRGQKTGFFLDQRENRLLARLIARGRSVLNLFAFSGGFGVNAARGGARFVEEVDVSGPAIDAARENHERNGGEAEVAFVVEDAFELTRRRIAEKREYDLIVCDPPAFAKSRKDVDRAARGYKDINLQVFRLAAPGAHVMTFSCSGHMPLDLFQKVVFSAALDARREVSILRRLGAGEDHPVSLYAPEGEYLKGFLLRVDR